MSCSLSDFCWANALLESKLRPIAMTAMEDKLTRLHRFIIVISFEIFGSTLSHRTTILWGRLVGGIIHLNEGEKNYLGHSAVAADSDARHPGNAERLHKSHAS